MTASKLAQAKAANADLPPMSIWRSSVFWGIILAAVGPLLKQFGLIANWDDAAANQFAELITTGTTTLGSAIALYGRVTQKAAPPLKVL